ncbi:MAG TPA: caspase family protein, partial [Candidatus Binatia bacterium]|nr:caspase family protein [Candidatus Binatia bacterium]
DNGNLMTVAWSQDGDLLYAAGRYRNSSGTFPILKWTRQGRGPATTLPAATDTVMDLHALKGGRLAFGACDPVFGVLASDGSKAFELVSDIVSFMDTEKPFRVSQDGAVVEFGFGTLTPQGTWQQRLARFDLAGRRLTLDPPPAQTLSPPRTTGLNITDWRDTTEPRLNGKPLPLERYETSRSLAIARDHASFLLGADWYLRLFDRNGTQRWKVEAPGVAWVVNLSGDGRYALAAFGDGTIRWYTVKDGTEVLVLFLHRDGKRWIAWTPAGFFDAAEGGEALVGYHLNQGSEQAGEFVKADQLLKLFYRPDLVAKRLQSGQEQAMREALARIGDVRQVLAGGLPPELELLSPAEAQSDGEFVLRFKVKDQGGGIGRAVYRVNGQELEGRPEGIGIPGQSPVSRRFPLGPGKSVVSAAVYNGQNQIESRAIQVTVNVRPTGEQSSLYVLAVGITNYRDRAFQLKYAAADAAAIKQELEQQGTGLFQVVPLTPLLDRDATVENISKAFDQLEQKVKAQDIFILYLAGHGAVFDGEYYFIPWEMKYENEDTLRATSLNQSKLRELLGKIPAQKTLVLLDTCSSGAFSLAPGRAGPAEKAALDRLMKLSGRAVLAAAADSKMALEGYEGHGVFTYALLQALGGKAPEIQRDGTIHVDELASYVADEVPRITLQRWGYEQFPMRNVTGVSFPIARRP